MAGAGLRRDSARDFGWLLKQSRRGRLWLLVGYAPLTGKTRRLLEVGRQLSRRGLDAVLAHLDPRDQDELARLAPGLEAVPPRNVEYRGMTMAEMDLEAVLARRPLAALVDGLGHANPPGSSHPKRWQDAAELLEAGVSVVATVDLGDLEGALPNGADHRRSLPESFWRTADRLEILDTSLEELFSRLARARSADPAAAEPDKDQPAELARLRARALELAAQLAAPPPAAPAPAPGSRVMVCLAAHSPRGHSLLTRGESLARRLGTDWFVVHVRPPGEEPSGPDAEILAQARGRGAEVAQLAGRDPVAALVDFARAHGVGHIILGRSLQPWWRQALGRSPMLRLVREAAGFDLHIVETADAGETA
jgi:two-component system sensor histidine kinase KdpD